MNLKVLFLILIYWGLFLIIFSVAGSTILTDEGYSVSASLNESAVDPSEIDEGGFFGTGVSFTRFVGFALFGVGLPGSTPSWMAVIIATWQTLWTLLTIGFVVSSIWDG